MARTSSFRTILVPVDGSPLAEEALPLARRIAEQAGSRLRLALVHQIPAPPRDAAAKLLASIYPSVTRAERSYLRALQARLRQEGVRLASAVTLRGPAGPTLAQYASDLGIDLIVMATHGLGGFRRAWIGSVADYLVRHLQVPVLLVRPGEGRAAPAHAAGAKQILVPLDGSPLAEEALGPAGDLARLWGAEVMLLRVVQPVALFSDELLGWQAPYDAELTEQFRDQAEDYVRDIAERLRGGGLRATGVASVGWGVADSILEAARPEHVAAIAIATHGRGGLQRLALGSVADKLIRGAEVPVLVYRPTRIAKPKRPRRTSARATGKVRR